MPSVIKGSDNFDTDTDLVVLSGADLTAVGIIGANPYASLCKRDGSIVGGSDLGVFTKWANGNVSVSKEQSVAGLSITTVAGSLYTTAAIGQTLLPLEIVHADTLNYGMKLTVAGANIWIGTATSTESALTHFPNFKLMCSVSKSDQDGYLKTVVTGRWK